ncbi:MAG: hypothetical protein AABY13_05930 [Nanoarchaeota archaeon]
MAFVTGLLLSVMASFVALLITFKFFPKYRMGWKDKLVIAAAGIGSFIVLMFLAYVYESFVGALDTNTRPAFGSVAFENTMDSIGQWMPFVFIVPIVLSVMVYTLQWSGMGQKDSLKAALVWALITAILLALFVSVKSAVGA